VAQLFSLGSYTFMLTAPSYEDVCSSLHSYMSPSGRRRDVRLVGLVFCQPHSKFTTDEILPALRYFHRRSGEHVNFYFAGYYEAWEALAGDVMVVPPAEGPGWAFSPVAFDKFRQKLQQTTSWRYSGGSDFILANARFDTNRDSAYLDFSSALSITFERLKHDGALADVGILFERIFSYAESCDGVDPTWGFSDSEGKSLVGSSLKNLVVSILPTPLRQDAKTAFHFVSTDLRR